MRVPNAGKRPGVKSAGEWYPKAAADFAAASAEALPLWHDMGASVGIVCTAGTCAIDIDSLNAEHSTRIVEIAHAVLGVAPRRIGKSPKVLLPYRCAPDTSYRQLSFNDGRPGVVGSDGKVRFKRALVELLAGETRFFVAWGVHPDTKQPYHWPDGVWPHERLQLLPSLDEFWSVLLQELPEARLSGLTSPATRTVDQERLRGDPRLIAEAMAVVPNDVEHVGYEQWRDMAAALRGAVDYDTGLELFEAWTDKAGIEKPTENAARVYGSLAQENIRLGADYIYAAAEAAGWSGLVTGWFVAEPEVEPQAAPMFPWGGEDAAAVAVEADEYGDVDRLLIPHRDFLYGFHIVRKFVSMTVAPSKVGKSTLATLDVLAMVTGRALLPGMRPKGPLRVWYINGEDPLEEIQRRFEAAKLKYGITTDDIGGRLFVNSGRSLRLVVAHEVRGGVEVVVPLVSAVIAELRAKRIDVLEIDPFVSSHRVKENDNTAIEAVVAEWVRVADEANCAIEFVHHSRKAAVGGEADDTIDSARGASAMVAKMRSVRALARMTKAQAERLHLSASYRSLFRVTDAASNLAPWVNDETEWLKLESVDLGNVGEGEWQGGDQVAVVVPWSAVSDVAATASDREVVLQFIGVDAYREDAQAREEWIGFAVAAALNLDVSDGEDKGRVKRLVAGWLKEGVLVRFRQQDKRREKRWYVKAASVLD